MKNGKTWLVVLFAALIAGAAWAGTSIDGVTGCVNTQVLVLASASTATPTTALSKRRAVYLQNLGPNPIFCTMDGQTALATGALGLRIDSFGMWSGNLSDGAAIKCKAATADQVSTAATQVLECI
jgi:hypothetical protein